MRRDTGILLLAALLAAGLPGCGRKTADRAAERPRASGVETANAQTVTRERTAEATGTVRSARIAEVAARVMGRIVSIPVAEGDRVEEGALLASIDDTAIRAQRAAAESAVAEAEAAREEVERAIAQAEAAKDLAEKTFERFRALHGEKVVTDQEFDEVQAKKTMAEQEYRRSLHRRSQTAARLAQAKAQAEAAEAMLSYTKITAPFAGVVTGKKADPGSMASPGMPILVLEDPGRHRMEASVPESFLGRVRAGSRVTVVLDADAGRKIAGTVSEVVPRVDPATRTFTAKVDLPGVRGLRTGMSGRIRFATGTETVVAVPEGAILRAGGYEGIFVVGQDNVARLTMVRTGERFDGRVEILSGIDPGTRVAVSPPGTLVDGAKVEGTR
ncbi:MAG: efflux RND transporter periplasmic adaptor subunit [Deltaproteobacteria bacterium]